MVLGFQMSEFACIYIVVNVTPLDFGLLVTQQKPSDYITLDWETFLTVLWYWWLIKKIKWQINL